MASIGLIIEQIKKNPAQLLDHLPVREVCLQLGLNFRDRCLDPATTVALFIQQILDGNSSCAAVRHRGARRFSPQAYCKARQRLDVAVLRGLSRSVCDEARAMSCRLDHLFLTHRVFVVDGSSFSMPDTPALQEHFGQSGQQKKGCGFPVAHLLAMFDVNSGMLIEAIASPLRTHDLKHIGQMHPHLRAGDLLMGDTAFGSYAHFALLLQAKLHGLMPMHHTGLLTSLRIVRSCIRTMSRNRPLIFSARDGSSLWAKMINGRISWSNGSSPKSVPGR